MRKAYSAAPDTLAQIRRDIRSILPRLANGDEIAVTLREGEYKSADFIFTEDDCRPDVPITYRGEGKVIINGGITLSPAAFEPLTADEKSRLHGDARERVVRVDLTQYGIAAADLGAMPALGSHTTAWCYDGAVSTMYCELFVDGCRMTVARYPNDGFLHTLAPIYNAYLIEENGVVRELNHWEWQFYRNPKSDIQRIDLDTAARVGTWRTLRDVWVFGYPRHMWADMSAPIHRLDAVTGEMELTYASMFGVKEDAPYYFYNVFEELDVPGEWYLDRENGILYLYPPTECAFADAQITLSLGTTPVVCMTNVCNLTLADVTVTASRTHGMAIDGDGITVENCTVSNVADFGIVIDGNRNTVRGCEIMHTGRGGVSVSGGDRATLTPSESIVTNCHIHDVGEIYKTYEPAVHIDGVGVTCSHNELHEAAHMMIGFAGNNHVIEYNEIYRACTFAADSGAIYSGRDYTWCGNIVRCNFFHDLGSAGDCHAVYCDDNNGSCTVEKNVFLRCVSAFHMHGGHDMTFKNNVILEACAESECSFCFSEFHFPSELLPSGFHAKGLAAVPWQSEVWTSAYPHIGEYLTWDIDKEQRFPHYSDISNNIIVNHKPPMVSFDWDNPRFKNRYENNIEVTVDDITALTNETLRALLPTFEDIPFAEIGRKK